MPKRIRLDDVEEPVEPAAAPSPAKFVRTDDDSTEDEQTDSSGIACALPPHTREPLVFTNRSEFYEHYYATHIFVCDACNATLPDEHFLNLHFAEYHDPINLVKKDRGEKIYGCLLEDCDKMCSDVKKRRLHCIDKHGFPRNFDFTVIMDGIKKGQKTMLRPETAMRKQTSEEITTESGRNDPKQPKVGGNATKVESTRREPVQLVPRPNAKSKRPSQALGSKASEQKHGSQKRSSGRENEQSSDMAEMVSSMAALQFTPRAVQLNKSSGQL
jgi:hypothetical protein